MEKIKLSSLPLDTKVLVQDNYFTNTVEDIIDDLDCYRNKEIYTTREYNARFNAEDILDDAIETEECNHMYEDWSQNIKADITKEDIEDLQKIFDRILARNLDSNISYKEDKLIEIDM